MLARARSRVCAGVCSANAAPRDQGISSCGSLSAYTHTNARTRANARKCAQTTGSRGQAIAGRAGGCSRCCALPGHDGRAVPPGVRATQSPPVQPCISCLPRTSGRLRPLSLPPPRPGVRRPVAQRQPAQSTVCAVRVPVKGQLPCGDATRRRAGGGRRGARRRGGAAHGHAQSGRAHLGL